MVKEPHMKYLLSHKTSSLFLVAAAVLLLSALPLSAQNAGYDLLQTGSGASVDLSSLNLGSVPLQGQTIDGSLGNTDTIMHRTQNITGGNGSTPVEVTALFMKSTNSVNYNGQSVDVYVTLNNSGGKISTSVLPQPDSTSSSGTVTASGNSSGGTFDSNITVNADLIFVRAGTSVTNSANYVDHKAAPAITLTSSGSSWSSTPPSGYPSSASFPSGGFYPKPVHNGPHPVVPSSCNTTTSPTSPTSPTPTANAGTKSSTISSGPTGQFAVKVCAVAAQ
jgi:hypothetical protein